MNSLARRADDDVQSLPRRRGRAVFSTRRFYVSVTALFVVWVVLSGKLDAFHLGAGALGALVIAYFQHPGYDRRLFPVLQFLTFLPWFLVQVVLSNLRVAGLVLGGEARTAPRIVVLDVAPLGDVARAFLGCAITLTPGTLTVDFRGDELWVHALDDGSAADLDAGRLFAKVQQVFGNVQQP